MFLFDFFRRLYRKKLAMAGKQRVFATVDEKGCLQGPYEEYWVSGHLKTKCTYRDGHPIGRYRSYSFSGRPLEKAYYGTRWGYVKRYHQFSDKLVEKISYKDGERHGAYRYYYTNGKLYIKSSYRKGNLDGSYESYHENGRLEKKSYYKDGKLDGPSVTYYENGQLEKACIYKNGNLDGPLEDYYKNGQLHVKATYIEGKPEGPYVEYYENGQLKADYSYKNGEVDGPYVTYWSNGQLSEKGTYINGKKEGPFEKYDTSGWVTERCNYKGDRLEGVYEKYNAYDQPEERCFYKDGEKDGPCEFYQNGRLVWKGVYRDGILLGKEASSYLEEWHAEQDRIKNEIKYRRQEKILGGIKEKLAEVSDLEKVKAIVKPARTPERTETLARIMRVRRAKALLSVAAQKAQKEGNTEILQEIVEIAKPYAAREAVVRDKFHQRQVARRAERRSKKGRG